MRFPAAVTLLLLVVLSARAQVSGSPDSVSQGVRTPFGPAGTGSPVPPRRIPPEPRTGSRVFVTVEGDSVLMHFAIPDAPGKRAAVVVLADRFGVQDPVTAMLAVFAKQGFRAYTFGLRTHAVKNDSTTGTPVIDSTDVSLIAQAVVEIRNDSGSSGQAFLFAFDVGAAAGAEAAARLPIFTAVSLFSPRPSRPVLERLGMIRCPVQLNVGDGDTDITLERIGELRDTFTDGTKNVRINIIAGARPFFFNIRHPDYRKEAVNASWVDAIRFYRSAMQHRPRGTTHD